MSEEIIEESQQVENIASEPLPAVESLMNEDEQLAYMRGIIEALLFVNEKPVTLTQLMNFFEGVKAAFIQRAITQLREEYEINNRGMAVVEIAGGYQILSNPKHAESIREFYKTKHRERLSKPALETLAIIAYKQPVTRADIELIRGVNSDGVVLHLIDKELIKVAGRKDIQGKPFLYGTTKLFLEYFGLKSLESLPKLEEFAKLQSKFEEGMAPPAIEGAKVETTENTPVEQNADVKGESQNESGDLT